MSDNIVLDETVDKIIVDENNDIVVVDNVNVEYISATAVNSFTDITDFNNNLSSSDITVQKALNTIDNLHIPEDVTATDSPEIDFTLNGQNISASIKPNSIDETKLDSSINASLDKADSALQVETDPVFVASQAHNITVNDITNLSNLSGVNSGDQSSSDFYHNDLSGLNVGTDYLHLTQTEKDHNVVSYNHTLVTTGNPHNVTKSDVGLSSVDNTSDLGKPISTATQSALDLKADDSALTSHENNVSNPHSVTKSQVGLGNVPNIDTTNASNITSGTLPSNVLPPVAMTQVSVVADESSQLSLIAEEGDVAVRSDLNKSYMHNGGSTGTMSDWTELQTPTDSVLSVNGETGTVVLTTGDIGEGSNLYYTDSRVSANPDVVANTSSRHDAVTVTDSSEIDFTLNGQDITASLKSSSVSKSKLDSAVDASLDKADSALQSESDPVFTSSQAYNITASDITNLSNLSGVNTGDQDISGISINATAISNIESKTDYITVTQDVNLDTMESDVANNTTKVSNATHTGDVTGSTVLTISDNVVDEANLKLDVAPTDDYVLTADSTASGGMKWAQGSSGITWSTPVDADIVPDGNGTRKLGSVDNYFGDNYLNYIHGAMVMSKYSTNDRLDLSSGGHVLLITNNTIKLDVSDMGMQLGNANARVSTILDEDDMASDSDTALATQQSIKAYVDANGGGISIFECTVGATEADYTTLGAAITAGKTRILVIGDTTETGDITLPSNCLIQGTGMESVNIDMGDYVFDLSTNDEYSFKDLKLTFAFTTSKSLLDSSSKNLYMHNVHIINNSALANTRMVYDSNSTSSNKSEFNNMTLTMPSYANTGMTLKFSNVSNINIFPSSGSTNAISSSGCRINNIFLNHTSDISGSYLIYTDSTTELNNLYSYKGVHLYLSGKSNNIYLMNNNSYTYLGGNVSNSELLGNIFIISQSTLSNCKLQYVTYADDCNFSNCIFRNTFAMNKNRNTFTGCSFLFNTTITLSGTGNVLNGGVSLFDYNCSINITGNQNIVSNIQIPGGATVSGNDTTINSCRFGAVSGGGTNTITVNSGAERTIINGCRTDDVIVDNGTDTVGIGNVVY